MLSLNGGNNEHFTSGMNADSFEFLSKYILQDLQSFNDALALVGIYYACRTCGKAIYHTGDFFNTHIISRYGSRNFIDLYGGEWAGE